jgi:hypothetical protein
MSNHFVWGDPMVADVVEVQAPPFKDANCVCFSAREPSDPERNGHKSFSQASLIPFFSSV